MLTRRGAILLGASLALITLGGVRSDGILITLGLSGGLLLAGAWFLVRKNLASLSLSLRAPTRVYADHPFDLRVLLHNERSVLDSFQIRNGQGTQDNIPSLFIPSLSRILGYICISPTERVPKFKKIWKANYRKSSHWP